MPEFPLQFGAESHPGRYGPDTGPRHINAHVEQVNEGEPQFPIYMPHGLKSFATVSGGGKCRGMIDLGGHIYAVSGVKVVKIDPNGGVTELGAIPGSSDVIMARNAADPVQIVIISVGRRYVISNDTLSLLTDSDLPSPNSAAFADQRIVFDIPDGRLFWSDIDDATSIGALSFSTAEGAPDGLLRVFFHRLDLWLFGEHTTEIWRSTADTDEPFRRVSGGYIEEGCIAKHSVASLGDVLFWVNDKDQVIAARGYTPQAVSHLGVSRDISEVTDKDTLLGFTYYSDGTGYYVLTSPTWTWTLNINTGKWFEWKSQNQNNWRARHAAHFQNKYILGGDASGEFYEADEDTFDENGSLITWTVRNAPVHGYPHRVSVNRLYLDFVTGVGLNSTDTDESTPQVMMKYSDDGGRTWSKELHRSLGVDGDYDARVVYNNLGITGRGGRIFEISASAAVARGLRHAVIQGDLVGT